MEDDNDNRSASSNESSYYYEDQDEGWDDTSLHHSTTYKKPIVDNLPIAKDTDDSSKRGEILQNLSLSEVESIPNFPSFCNSYYGTTQPHIISAKMSWAMDENQEDDQNEWDFEDILDHQGPLKWWDQHYKGSNFNVHIKWTDRPTTWEPLKNIPAHKICS